MQRADGKGGHAIAFQILLPSSFRLFDPNLGEFRFTTTEDFAKNFRGFMKFMGYQSNYEGKWSILGFRYGTSGRV
jgi:Yersinia/Haemophilus virulence surface antigen